MASIREPAPRPRVEPDRQLDRVCLSCIDLPEIETAGVRKGEIFSVRGNHTIEHGELWSVRSKSSLSDVYLRRAGRRSCMKTDDDPHDQGQDHDAQNPPESCRMRM